VLPYSGYGYIKAMYRATMENFYAALSDMFIHLGGTPVRVKSDNMTQWVKRYDRYEPSFSASAVEWSTYYNVELETSRVRRPRDKGCVEGMVKKVYNAVYALMREETFYTLEELNTRAQELMDAFNSKVRRETGRSRMDVFESEEKMLLGPMPDLPYRYRHKKTVKLTGSYHIVVDQHKYSVPYQYVGQMLSVIWDNETVEVYSGVNRIAIHKRKYNTSYSTEEEHMPENHLAYKKSREVNAAYFMEQAGKIGPFTQDVVSRILKSTKHVQQSYNSCQGILRLHKAYGTIRLEKACERMSKVSFVTYTMISNVLKQNLDMVDQPETVTRIPNNTDVRGASAFINIISNIQ